jgi:hypothetical protein
MDERLVPVGCAAESLREEIHKSPDLGRELPVGRPYGMNRRIKKFVIAEHDSQRARCDRIADDEGRQHDQAQAGDGGVAQHVAIIDIETPRHHRRLPPFAIHAKTPLLRGGPVAVDETVMAWRGQVGRRDWHAAGSKIGRARADDMPAGRQCARDQRRIRQFADAYREVVALADQLHPAVVQVQLDVELRMGSKKFYDRWREVAPAEGHRRRHPQLASEFALQPPRDVVRFGDIGQDAPRPFKISEPGLRQAETPRGAVEQIRSEARFKRADPAADDRFRDAKPLRRAREAARFDYTHEHGHVVEKAHIVPMLRTYMSPFRRLSLAQQQIIYHEIVASIF